MSKYLVNCIKCKNQNEVFRLTCKYCGAFLHNKISNINLWNMFYTFLESPSSAIISIIQSEKKNFSFLLIILGTIKLSLLKHITLKYFEVDSFTAASIFISSSIKIILLVFVIKGIQYLKDYKIRIEDIFATISYSLFIEVISLFIILPIEYSFFGESLFSFNPSPFFLKPFTAYIFFSLEIIFLLFTIYYFYLVIEIFFNKRIISMFISILFFILLFSFL